MNCANTRLLCTLASVWVVEAEEHLKSIEGQSSFHISLVGQDFLIFGARMNLPPPVTKKVYNDHLIQIEKVAIKNAETLMEETAQRLIAKVAAEKSIDIKQDNGERIANIAVTIDGTWQKRGHSSKVGVVFAIAVLTGEILDFCVKSLVCHGCKAHDSMDKESDNYNAWKESHAPNCQINHHASSEEMESVAAIEIFSRSIQSRRLKYTTFVGDGDNSCYGKVREAMNKKCGSDYVVQKQECVGHVQKRLAMLLGIIRAA